jgi:hypothetical protein
VFVVCSVGSGLCDDLVNASEEFYRLCVSNCVCDLKTSTVRWSRSEFGCFTLEKMNINNNVTEVTKRVIPISNYITST